MEEYADVVVKDALKLDWVQRHRTLDVYMRKTTLRSLIAARLSPCQSKYGTLSGTIGPEVIALHEYAGGERPRSLQVHECGLDRREREETEHGCWLDRIGREQVHHLSKHAGRR